MQGVTVSTVAQGLTRGSHVFSRRLYRRAFRMLTQGSTAAKAELRRLRVRPPRFFRAHHTLLKVRRSVCACGGGCVVVVCVCSRKRLSPAVAQRHWL